MWNDNSLTIEAGLLAHVIAAGARHRALEDTRRHSSCFAWSAAMALTTSFEGYIWCIRRGWGWNME